MIFAFNYKQKQKNFMSEKQKNFIKLVELAYKNGYLIYGYGRGFFRLVASCYHLLYRLGNPVLAEALSKIVRNMDGKLVYLK